MARLIAIAVQRLGITEVRFTRGEPLLRRGLAGLIAAAAALRPRPEISLTTNGIGLARLAGPLRNAGLDRINVSLDTLSPQTLVTLARRDRLANVLPGLSAAAAAGLAPVKVNAVLMRGVNDHEAAPLLRLCLDRGYQLRVHRADAAGCPARLAADQHDHRQRDPGRLVRPVLAHPRRSSRPRISTRRDLPGR